MIRQITANEVWLTRDCAFGFFSESKLPGELDFDYWMGRWESLIKDLDIGAIFVYESDGKVKGILGGLCVRCTMTGQLEAIESFWYMQNECRGTSAGVRLLKAFEQWAEKKGASRIKMAHLANLNATTMASMYQRLAYDPLEVVYSKELPAPV